MAWLKIDLHTHTREDHQDRIKYNSYQLIDQAAQKGFDAIAITNHNSVFYTDLLAKYSQKKGILLIPGMEITLSGNHVLLINPDFKSNPKKRPLSDLKKIKNESNLIIAPHPFFPNNKSLRSQFFRYLPYFDAIEFSHCYNRFLNFNIKAAREAKKNNLPLIGTSDCHFLWEFGTTYSFVDAEKNIPSIINAVKNGKIRLATSPLSIPLLFRLSLSIIQVKIKNLISPIKSHKKISASPGKS
ncbi:MAG: PHP domain-containing protein [Candidatus Aminicenantes bacterium]|nr:PHP domain-containing protein [Candidatus Aminicenantes bacterium]